MQTDSRSQQPTNTLAAIFATQHDARDAIKDLHKAGFKKTWLGTLSAPDGDTGEPMVEDPGGLARFISAGGDRMSLHKSLIQHGVGEQQAERIEREVATGCVIVTVYGEDNPTKVEELLDVHKGHIVGARALPTAVELASMSPRTGVEKDERKLAEDERKVKDPKAHDLGREDASARNVDDDDDLDAYGDVFVEHRYRSGI